MMMTMLELSRQAGDIIEPYVKISVHGHPADRSRWVSSVIPRNGFNPLWQETAQFEITYPELAMLEFKVKSRTETHLGSHMISLNMVRRGYRHVSLESYDGTRLTPASLFVHVDK